MFDDARRDDDGPLQVLPGAPPPAPGRGQGPEERPPSRWDVLRRRRGALLLALALLVVASMVALGSLALLTGSSVNPANVVGAGTLEITSTKEGAAILTAAGMVPGESRDGTVRIGNAGDAPATFRLSDSELADTPGPNGGLLSGALDLTIVDLGPDGAPGGGDDVSPATYAGRFDALPSIDLGVWEALEEHTYRFIVTFRDTGMPGSATTQDNAFMGSSTKVTYAWTAASG